MMVLPLHQQVAAALQLVVINFVLHCVLVLELQMIVDVNQLLDAGIHLRICVSMDRLNQIVLDISFAH